MEKDEQGFNDPDEQRELEKWLKFLSLLSPEERQYYRKQKREMSEILSRSNDMLDDILRDFATLQVLLDKEPYRLLIQPQIIGVIKEMCQFMGIPFPKFEGQAELFEELKNAMPTYQGLEDIKSGKALNQLAKIYCNILDTIISQESTKIAAQVEDLKKQRRQKDVKDHFAKGVIRSFFRVRQQNSNILVDVASDKRVQFTIPKVSLYPNSKSSATTKKVFMFDHIFSLKSSQQQVFQMIKPYVDCSIQGNSSTIILHGASGTGKTFTISGHKDDAISSQRGFVFRALQQMFAKQEELQKQGWSYTFCLSAEEIYQAARIDMFCGAMLGKDKIRTIKNIGTLGEGQAILTNILNKRRTKETKQNSLSSNSHFCIFFKIFGRKKAEVKSGFLNVVDLAGSQSTSYEEDKEKKAETIAINSNIHFLFEHIKARNQDKPSSYGGCPLVKALLPYLEQRSLKLMIYTGSNNSDSYTSTLSNISSFEAKI